MKVTEETPISEHEKVYRGFHFLEMELSWENPQTGALERQLVIAVRMPPENKKHLNISNLHILKEVSNSLSIHNPSCLNDC